MTLSPDRLRILVALAVIRNTPADQDHTSYILSLREIFKLPSSEAPFDFWKSHARRLERECAELREALGKLQIRSFIDTHTTSTQPAELNESTVPSSSDSNNSLTTKKKSKKKPDSTAEIEVANLTEVLKCGRKGRPFETMDTFLQLWTFSDRPGFPRNVFFNATRDACKSISSAFDDATRERTNLKGLQVVQTTICALVDKAVPLVLSWITEHDEALLALLFDNLLEHFMTPVVPAFLNVSERNLSFMRNSDSGDNPEQISADYVDGRVSILALLQITFSHIHSALSIPPNECCSRECLARARADFSVMIHSFVLAIVRHLRDILREGDNTHKQKPTRRRRIRRLAVKDTLWYLCSAVHFLLDLQDRVLDSGSGKDLSRQQHRLELLRHAALDILVDLVVYQDRKRVLNFTESISKVALEDGDTHEEAINFLVLDDMGYRMFVSLVERVVVGDWIP